MTPEPTQKHTVYSAGLMRFINRMNVIDCSQPGTHLPEARSLPPMATGTVSSNTKRTGFGISLAQICLSQVEMSSISKKHFRPGGMAPSEWTRSVRAVRVTPVADYSAPSVNTTRRIAYRPPTAVSPFLLALSVSYIKQTLWHSGQLWPYIGMGSLGTRLHWDCNATGDAAKISSRVPSTLSSRSVGRWEDMILPGGEDPRNLATL